MSRSSSRLGVSLASERFARGRRAGRLVRVLILGALIVPAAFSVVAQSLSSLSISPSSVANGAMAQVTVNLTSPAPPGGLLVSLSSSNGPAAQVQGFVYFNSGEIAKTSVVQTFAVGSPTTLTIQASYLGVIRKTPFRVDPREPVRGLAGDLWADVILGKPAFQEVVANEVTGNRVFNPGGVLVDRTVSPNRVYVYDSGNSRVLGLSRLGTCASGTSIGAACTNNLDCPGSTCAVEEGRTADLVLGQPSFDRASCNGDGNFFRYPVRGPASAATLCSMPDYQISLTEGGSFANMAVDGAGNLYVPDWDNHRVLRYNSPFATDGIADDVWGQADFAANDCNRGRGSDLPDNKSLCYRSPYNEGFTGGVDIDSAGNLWVTDNRNGRVLRFPKDPATGFPGHTADLVLGQPNFTSSGHGSGLDRMFAPAAVRVDGSGVVYVADDLNNRVLFFSPPFLNGMPATGTLNYAFREPRGLEIDPVTGGVWVSDHENHQLLLFVGGAVSKVLFKDVPNSSHTCGGAYTGDGPPFVYSDGRQIDSYNFCVSGGGLGVDSAGNVFAASLGAFQDVWRFPAPFPSPTPGIAHSADKIIFKGSQVNTFNQVGLSGLNSPRGVAVTGSQIIVADAYRLLFWNDPQNVVNGQVADGYAETSNPLLTTDDPLGRIRADTNQHLWVIHRHVIKALALPLVTGAAPIKTLTSPLPVLGGGTLSWTNDWDGLNVGGLAPVGAGDRLWVADPGTNRVFRIRNPLTTPVVDIILGQGDAAGTACNRGSGPASPAQNTLCRPGAVTLDPQGNLFVSDHALEVTGNFRLLEFDASLFPDFPATALFGIPASRVFGTGGSFTAPGCQDVSTRFCMATWEPAFTSSGQMVIGLNAYGGGYNGSRFPMVFQNPLASEDVTGFLNDFTSMAYAATFDANDDLYFVDLNRMRLLIYRKPLPAPAALAARALAVDVHAGAGGPGSANGILEPGENVFVEPSWQNTGTTALSLTGTASGFTGPAGPEYLISDTGSDYGAPIAGATSECFDATGNCYRLTVSNPATRPSTHWDATFVETLDSSVAKTWTLHIGASFGDVPVSHTFYKDIERLLHKGVTTGCTPTAFCPDDAVSRLQMAIFIARAQAGSDAGVPPSGTAQGSSYNCTGGGTSLFSDVEPTNPFCRHVHYIYGTGVTTGCEPGKYCPGPEVSRAQMAMFVARAMAGSDAAVPPGYGPDPGTGRSYNCTSGSPNLHFTDVTTEDIFCRHTHFLWAKDVISGFPDNSYQPGLNVTRGAMAKFLSNGFDLKLYGP